LPPDDDPLLVLVELLGRRHGWSLVWTLRHGAHSAGSLTRVVGADESVALQRLRELRSAGLVEVDEVGDYRLTTHGRRMLDPIESLSSFAESWSRLTPRQRTPRGSIGP
jgi:DNA-binding HxlR family transcriptional regulator